MTTVVTTSKAGPLFANHTTPIPFTFQSLSSEELEVLRDGEVVSPSAYTVTRNTDGTGSINPKTSWGTSKVIIRSAPNFKQLTSFSRFGVFFPDQINSPLDRLARTIIALKDELAELRARIEECCDGGGDGGEEEPPPPGTLYFPATGLWNDTELFADTALWKDA